MTFGCAISNTKLQEKLTYGEPLTRSEAEAVYPEATNSLKSFLLNIAPCSYPWSFAAVDEGLVTLVYTKQWRKS
jgi:hypothetical protein